MVNLLSVNNLKVVRQKMSQREIKIFGSTFFKVSELMQLHGTGTLYSNDPFKAAYYVTIYPKIVS